MHLTLAILPCLLTSAFAFLRVDRVCQNAIGKRTFSSFTLRMSEEVDLAKDDAAERMDKSVDSVKRNFGTVRTGRANPGLLDRVVVDYYGAETPLNQLASVAAPSAQDLKISPYDKTCIGDIEKAISESGLGLSTNNDGEVIRINIPPLTGERRKELQKQVKAIAEEGKVAIRNIRRDANDVIKKLQKDKAISEDESKEGQDDVQKLTDKYIKEVETALADKESELAKV